jgi:hypothetical protein
MGKRISLVSCLGGHSLDSCWYYLLLLPPSTKPSVCITEITCSKSEDAGSSAEVPTQDTASLMPEASLAQTPIHFATIKSPPRAKRGKHLHISKADLRRSDRLHSLNKGFKSAICRDRDCLGCSSDPPSLPASVVRDLGATFCKQDKKDLTDKALNAKPTKKGVVGRPRKRRTMINLERGLPSRTTTNLLPL